MIPANPSGCGVKPAGGADGYGTPGSEMLPVGPMKPSTPPQGPVPDMIEAPRATYTDGERCATLRGGPYFARPRSQGCIIARHRGLLPLEKTVAPTSFVQAGYAALLDITLRDRVGCTTGTFATDSAGT
jgi:hypothetical protein